MQKDAVAVILDSKHSVNTRQYLKGIVGDHGQWVAHAKATMPLVRNSPDRTAVQVDGMIDHEPVELFISIFD